MDKAFGSRGNSLSVCHSQGTKNTLSGMSELFLKSWQLLCASAREGQTAPASAPALGEERENHPDFGASFSSTSGTATPLGSPECSAKLERHQEQSSGIWAAILQVLPREICLRLMVDVIRTEPRLGHGLQLENQTKIQNRLKISPGQQELLDLSGASRSPFQRDPNPSFPGTGTR